jgi:hypothetical protein
VVERNGRKCVERQSGGMMGANGGRCLGWCGWCGGGRRANIEEVRDEAR